MANGSGAMPETTGSTTSFDLQAFNRVIEVGGYLGNWTDYIHGRYSCFVDTYEPVKEFCEQMAVRFNNRPKIEVINAGLQSFAGESKMAVMGEGSSMYNGGVPAALP